jgi:hypothetical protein
VGTVIFTKGEEGLLPGLNDDENGDVQKEQPEWEKFLSKKL